MDNLEKHISLKIHDIVGKLHKLDCSLLGNEDDAWIMELLFKPGLHRCNLIEWILSKFMYVKPQDAAENRMKNLQSIISDLGICRKNINDIVEGTASLKEQLQFWGTLVDIIWLKYEITSTVSVTDSTDKALLSPEKSLRMLISEEFDDACSSVAKFCESGNMQHIFMHDLPLLAPDVEREIKNVPPSKVEIQQKLDELIKEDSIQDVHLEIYKKLCSSKIPTDENKNNADVEIELNELEEELCKVSTDLKNIAQGAFNDVHKDLKPLILNVEADSFVDVGPAFQKVEPLLNDFLQLNKSFPKLESTNSILSKVNLELEDLLNQDTLADEKYVNTYRLLSDEN